MELFDTHFHYDGEDTPAGFMANVRMELAVPPQLDAGTVDSLELLAMGDFSRLDQSGYNMSFELGSGVDLNRF